MLRPPNRRNRSASLNFLICPVRVGCDTYSTVAARVKLFSFATATKELNYFASVSALRGLSSDMRTYSARANGWLFTCDAGNIQSAKAPIDTMTSATRSNVSGAAAA